MTPLLNFNKVNQEFIFNTEHLNNLDYKNNDSKKNFRTISKDNLFL